MTAVDGAKGDKAYEPVEMYDHLGLYRDLAGFFEEPVQKIVLVTNHDGKRMPNTFFYQPDEEVDFDPNRPLQVVATKVDIGGTGGHVSTHALVNRVIVDFLLRHNRVPGTARPIFRGLLKISTGDDICIFMVTDARTSKVSIEQLLWDAFDLGGESALRLGLYGPKQDLMSEAFTGNLHGSGPASVRLPLPLRPKGDQASQIVALMTGDKCDPSAFNYAIKPYMNPENNTGLFNAETAMRLGYLYEVVDMNTKLQAVEAGIHPNDAAQVKEFMIAAKGTELAWVTEDVNDVKFLIKNPRYVVRRIWTRNAEGGRGELVYVASAERLHNVPNKAGKIKYGGKDDPVAVALLQQDCPALGEFGAVWIDTPLVKGGCRGSHWGVALPMPFNSDTSFWSGPIIQLQGVSLNLHTGLIGGSADHFASGGPNFDRARAQGAERFEWIRRHGFMEPATLADDEMEYHDGFNQRLARIKPHFEHIPATEVLFEEDEVHELQAVLS